MALPSYGEAALLSVVSSVGRIRLARAGQGLRLVSCGLSELQARLGVSPRRLALTLCCQRRCHPRIVLTRRPGWGWQQGMEEWQPPLCNPSLSKSKHVSVG